MLDLNELKNAAKLVYLTTDKTIADDISLKLLRAVREIEDLREFSRWLTGCGYDFTQHKCFCEDRDRLLVKDPNGSRKD